MANTTTTATTTTTTNYNVQGLYTLLKVIVCREKTFEDFLREEADDEEE